MADSALDDLVPTAHWRIQLHRTIPADVTEAFARVDRVRLDQLGLATLISSISGLGTAVRGGDPLSSDRPVIEHLYERGWSMLALHPGEELLLGRIGRRWADGETEATPRSPEEFDAIGGDDLTKAAMSLRVGSAGPDTLAVLDTRVVATDRRAHGRTNRDWRFRSWAHRMMRHQFLEAMAGPQ